MAAAADSVRWTVKPAGITSFSLRLVISLVFAFAAIGKLLDFADFERSLAAIEWLPTPLILPSAAILILAELSSAALLLTNRTARTGTILACVLSCLFGVYTAQRILFGASVDCACFGIFLKLNPWVMLVIDFAIALVSVVLLRSTDIGQKPIAGTDAPNGSPSVRLPIMISVLLVCAWAFFRVLPNDPLLQMKLSGLLDVRRSTQAFNPITPAMLKDDPKLQTTLDVPRVHGTNPDKPTIVGFAAGCAVCSLGGIDPAEQVGRLYGDNVILITPRPLAEMRTFVRDHGLRALVLSDPSDRWADHYNATFRPRTYVLDPNHRLVWKQDGMRPDQGEIEKVAQIVGEGAPK